MRILMTTETTASVWIFTRELTTELLRRGHTIALVSFGRKPSYDQQTWCDLETHTCGDAFQFVASNTSLEWMENNEFTLQQGAGILSRIAAQFRPDVFHSNQFCFGSLSLPVPKLVTAHTDVLSWAEACRPHGLAHSRWLSRYRSLVTKGLHQADIVAAPTNWMAGALCRHYGNLSHCYVVANGRSVDLPPPTQRFVQAVTIGTLWDEAKNVEVLRSVRSPMPIQIVGERRNGSSIAARQIGTSILIGALPESALVSLLSHSSLYLVTSLYEPFGLAALEAAQCGCGVVARDLPSLREVWGDSALYFKAASELSAILHQLNRDSAQMASLRESSQVRAAELSAQRMADGYERLYSRLLAAPGTRRSLAPHAA